MLVLWDNVASPELSARPRRISHQLNPSECETSSLSCSRVGQAESTRTTRSLTAAGEPAGSQDSWRQSSSFAIEGQFLGSQNWENPHICFCCRDMSDQPPAPSFRGHEPRKIRRRGRQPIQKACRRLSCSKLPNILSTLLLGSLTRDIPEENDLLVHLSCEQCWSGVSSKPATWATQRPQHPRS